MQLRKIILSAALCLAGHAFAQSALPPTSGLPAPELTGTAAPATLYTCDASHYGVKYTQTTATGVSAPYICNPIGGTPTWILISDSYGFVNGAAVPAIGGIAAVDATGHVVAPTAAQLSIKLNGTTCTLGSCNLTLNVQGEQTITYSATPAFVATVATNYITLTGNVTSFTMAAGTYGGQNNCVIWAQDATGGRTVPASAAPTNVIGFAPPGTTANKRSQQCFQWGVYLNAWTATSTGILNF